MNTKIFIRVVVLLAACLFVISCAPKEKRLIDVDPAYTNKQILLRTASFLNTYKTKDPIFLELKYNDTNEIVFPTNYNLRIFYKIDNNEWIEINEKPTRRFPEGDIVFSPNKQMPIAEAVVVYPDLPNLVDNYILRIYVIGDMATDQGTNKVAAFTEMKLIP